MRYCVANSATLQVVAAVTASAVGQEVELSICDEVESRLYAWSEGSLKAYKELEANIKAIELAHGGVYLFDECVTIQNLPEGITEKSVAYWHHMLRTAFSDCTNRAEDAGIDLNKALGYTIY